MARLVMKLKQLVGTQGQEGVSPTLVVAELDFVHTGGESFDNRTNLAAQKLMVVAIFQQCHHRE
jgi:hypothetical protein